MWRNRLVNDTFEPGSIFKVVTMGAALEEEIVEEEETFVCNGSLRIGPHTIKCWRRGDMVVKYYQRFFKTHAT